MENIDDLWDYILSELESILSKPSYETWLKQTYPISFVDNNLTIAVRNEFLKTWLRKQYTLVINHIIYEITGTEIKITFIYEKELEEDNPQEKQGVNKQMPIPAVNTETNNGLNAKYTFNSFVVGAANRFAHAACLAVAEAPAKSYNPLFIYGGVGLGKTHLMHAISHYVHEHHPELNVIYLSSEKFTNEFINAIMDNKADYFRNKYRNVDILLIDDIQFLAGKEQTQEEFFHTFNTLHEDNKQIVISSDRPPREIPTLEERLRSRFEWGLITDISPPDLETRIAILTKKAKAEGIEDITSDVMHYIANQFNTNIRELEGALIRVTAYASLVNSDIDVTLATEALKDIIPNNRPKKITINGIQTIVVDKYHITMDEMLSKKRTKNIAFPRQIAMYLSRELTDLSLPKIGEEFGGRDHTTVIHAHKKITEEIAKDTLLDNEISRIKEEIQNTLSP